eukprot:4093145-Heterocapsa_arctica.AAC.1
MAPAARRSLRRRNALPLLGRAGRAGTKRQEHGVQDQGSTCVKHIIPAARRPTGGTAANAHGYGRRRA